MVKSLGFRVLPTGIYVYTFTNVLIYTKLVVSGYSGISD